MVLRLPPITDNPELNSYLESIRDDLDSGTVEGTTGTSVFTIYATSVSGANQSFSPGTRTFVYFHESLTKPTLPLADVLFVEFKGASGDNAIFSQVSVRALGSTTSFSTLASQWAGGSIDYLSSSVFPQTNTGINFGSDTNTKVLIADVRVGGVSSSVADRRGYSYTWTKNGASFDPAYSGMGTSDLDKPFLMVTPSDISGSSDFFQCVVTSSGNFTVSDGITISDVIDGTNVATVQLYKANTSNSTPPTDPTGTFTYTFSNNTLSGGTLDGWDQTATGLSTGQYLWMIQASAVSLNTSVSIAASAFSNAILMSSNITGGTGETGARQTNGIVYRTTTDSTPPSAPTNSNSTYSFNDAAFTTLPSGWSQVPPVLNTNDSDPYYQCTFKAVEASAGGNVTETFGSVVKVITFDGVVKFTNSGASLGSTVGGSTTTVHFPKTFKQSGIPTSLAKNDVWIDTDDNLMYIALSAGADQITAGEWERSLDATAQAAATAANTAAVNAASAASTAAANAATAQGELNDISSDSVLTPVEKLAIKPLWDTIRGVQSGIIATAVDAGISTGHAKYIAFTSAYTALTTYLVTGVGSIAIFDTNGALVLSSGTPPELVNTTIVRSTFDLKFKTYYDSRQALLDLISETLKDRADVGVQNALTAQNKANDAFSNAATAQGELNDISSDAILTPVEKLSIKTLWDSIRGEYAGIIATSVDAGVATNHTKYTTYTSAYTALTTYLVSGTGTISLFDSNGALVLSSGTPPELVNTSISRTSGTNAFDLKFKTYYDARQGLLDFTASTLKDKTDTAQDKADDAFDDAATAQAKANTAFDNAATAQGELDDIASDVKVTPVEKIQVKIRFDTIIEEYSGIISAATNAGCNASERAAYVAANTALDSYLTTTATGNIDGTNTRMFNYDGVLWLPDSTHTIVIATWRGKFNDYYNTKQALLDLIVSKLKATAVAAQNTATAAQNTANNKTKTFYQQTMPSADSVGDVWVDTNDSDKMYFATNANAGPVSAGRTPSYWILEDFASVINANTTTIDGGKITANSVTALEIQGNTITANQIAANAITVDELHADAVTGKNILIGDLAVNTSTGAVTGGEGFKAIGTGTGAGIVSMGDATTNITVHPSSGLLTLNGDVVGTANLNASSVTTNSTLFPSAVVITSNTYQDLGTMTLSITAGMTGAFWFSGFISFPSEAGNGAVYPGPMIVRVLYQAGSSGNGIAYNFSENVNGRGGQAVRINGLALFTAVSGATSMVVKLQGAINSTDLNIRDTTLSGFALLGIGLKR
jgi:hypothetical protein